MSGAAERRYREALERHGLRDVQAAYRELLRRLKSSDTAAYEEATARYRERVEPEAAEGEADPLSVWVAYGRWLAERVSPGRAVAVGPDGRAEAVRGEAPLGPLLLHLPERDDVPALLLAMPARPTPSQEVTAELLCG